MNRFGKWLVVGAALSATAVGGSGCLTRPISKQAPTTKENYATSISQQAVDKVDLLFMIDNSSSMADKQAILADAVPNLIQGLLKPKCVSNADGTTPVGGTADPNGNKDNNYGCPAQSQPEFKPVTDMHIGIVSSSLGTFGGDVCPDSGRYNDHGHLLNFVKGGGEVASAKPSNFLAWFPNNQDNQDALRHPPPATPSTNLDTLTKDFQTLVIGTDQTGCGFEAQLESWYHFLVAPDPWVSIKVDGQGLADFGTDVDTDLIQQRADFLRPDSLVAIISLSDETDSSVDPNSLGGQGWAFSANKFPGSPTYRSDGRSTTAPRPTSACATNPGSADCTSCGFAATCDKSKADCQKIVNDPNCQKTGGYYGPTEDQLNVRFHRMKERYGIDPQYPIQRYVDGLTKDSVADRAHEHPITGQPGARSIGGYSPSTVCTNPLFAAKLPRNPGDELCKLQKGTRSSSLVYFAHIGGVPNQLLHFKAGDTDASRVTDDDWIKILGRDPTHYNYDGIDPHMIESVSPRQNLPAPSATRGDNGTDPIHGREWDTNGDDLQFACTFNLPTARTCTSTDSSCDCGKATNPPLCGATAGQQVKAKAYPTVREFYVVRALKENGIAASLCPIQLTDPNAPDYGYKPAVAAIIDRLKNALTVQCLPRQLTRDPQSGQVPCLVLVQLSDPADSCDKHGLKLPDPAILQKFLEQQKAASGNTQSGGTDLSKLPVCQMPQDTVAKGATCKDQTDLGWCYVENDPGAKAYPASQSCGQAIIFTSGSASLSGARFSLQCIREFSEGQAAGDVDAAAP